MTISFGKSRDNDQANGMVKGKFTLTLDEIVSVFEWVVERILGNIGELIANRPVKVNILLSCCNILRP
jgi:hypothetical protein